jgi:hypothetical protein
MQVFSILALLLAYFCVRYLAFYIFKPLNESIPNVNINVNDKSTSNNLLDSKVLRI